MNKKANIINSPKVLYNSSGQINGFRSVRGVEYYVDELLGGGISGDVYLVKSKAGDKAAIKVGTRVEKKENIESELSSFKKIYPNQSEHDFVVYKETPAGQLFVSMMPLIEGADISKMIRKQGGGDELKEQPLSHIFYSLSTFFAQLETLHMKFNAVHGDIKSENIISGVYEHYDPDQPSAIVNYMSLVDYGLLKENVNSVTVRPMQGTPQTMAPEQWQGQYYYQSDIYSSAEVVGVMLGGELQAVKVMSSKEINDKIRENINKKFGHSYDEITSSLPHIITNIFDQMREADPLDRPTASELFKIFNLLENTFRGLEMAKRFDDAIDQEKSVVDAIAVSQQRDSSSIRSILNDLPEAKLKIEIYRYLVSQNEEMKGDLSSEVQHKLSQINDPENSNQVLNQLAAHMHQEFMNHFEMQNNHLYKHSLVEKLQDQVGLLDEVILDLMNGLDRYGVNTIEHDRLARNDQTNGDRPEPVNQRLYGDFYHKKEVLNGVSCSLKNLCDEFKSVIRNLSDDELGSERGQQVLSEFLRSFAMQKLIAKNLNPKIREYHDNITIIDQCLASKNLNADDYKNLKKIRKKMKVKIGDKLINSLFGKREDQVRHSMLEIKQSLSDAFDRLIDKELEGIKKELGLNAGEAGITWDIGMAVRFGDKLNKFERDIGAELKLSEKVCRSYEERGTGLSLH